MGIQFPTKYKNMKKDPIDSILYKSKENLFDLVRKSAKTPNVNTTSGCVNNANKSSFSIKKDGAMTLATGQQVQFKQDKGTNTSTEISHLSNCHTIVRKLELNDLIINHHKLNSQLYELTNMKNVMGTAVGNLTVNGTVLVKTWEASLNKWVLIRRQVRVPIFSNLLNSYSVEKSLGLDLSDTYSNIGSYKINRNNKDILNSNKKEGN